MSGLEVTVVVLVSAWLGILSLVMLLSIRQIGLVTARLEMTAPIFDMESDGLDIGMSIPDEPGLILPELLSPSPTYLVLLSASCDPCRELAYELHRASLEGVANLVAVVSCVVNPKYRTVS